MKWIFVLLVSASLFASVLPTVYAQEASWEPCYAGLLRCDSDGIIWESAAISEEQLAQLAANDGLEEALIKIGDFAAGPVLNILLVIAFLFFLYSIARYFIVAPVSSDTKKEGKQAALYGIAAFVVIGIIWGVVNLLVTSTGIKREQSICPDYMKLFAGACGEDINNHTGGGNIGGNGTNNAPGAVSGTPPATTAPEPSALGALVFGEYTDMANFNYAEGSPRAAASTVTIDPVTRCVDGLSQLKAVATIESNQVSYALYKEGPSTNFINLSDMISNDRIDIDADTLRNLGTKEKLTIIHVHPQKFIDAIGLPMSGHAPSAADMELMCDGVANDATYLVIDKNHVWTMNRADGICSAPPPTNQLMAIDTLLQMSLMNGSNRVAEYEKMLAAANIPGGLATSLSPYTNTDFRALSSAEVVTLADDLARSNGMHISRQTIQSFCSAY